MPWYSNVASNMRATLALFSCIPASFSQPSSLPTLLGKIKAMKAYFGAPAIYYTVAPNDVDNRLTLELCRPPDDVEDIGSLELVDRFRWVGSNAPAAARVFSRQVRALFDLVRTKGMKNPRHGIVMRRRHV